MPMAPGNAAELAGQSAIPSTTSLDLPSSLAKLVSMDMFNPAGPMTQPAGLMTSVSPAAMAQNTMSPMTPQYAQGGMIGEGGYPALPHYADGGAVGPSGMPLPPGQPPMGSPPMGGMPPQAEAMMNSPQMQQYQATPMDPSQMHGMINQQIAQNPDAANQIQGEIIKALQSGQLSTQQLSMGIQLIEAAVNNPSLYPQLRQFAVQQGLAEESDIPPQYDKGFVMLLLTVAKSAQQLVQGGASMAGMPGGGGGAMPGGGDAGAMPPGMPPMKSMRMGGHVGEGSGAMPGSGKPQPIMAHEGEYVVPRHVVGMKGREFFDKLVEKYSEGS